MQTIEIKVNSGSYAIIPYSRPDAKSGEGGSMKVSGDLTITGAVFAEGEKTMIAIGRERNKVYVMDSKDIIKAQDANSISKFAEIQIRIRDDYNPWYDVPANLANRISLGGGTLLVH